MIGTGIGMVPGVGQVVAAFVGYSAAKRASKHPETFGKGELDGIAGPEAANNAVNGPTLVPLLTLGIPGDNITAILLGAFVAHGLRPGPQIFNEQGAAALRHPDRSGARQHRSSWSWAMCCLSRSPRRSS